MHEAYDAEVSSAGYWPGGADEGAFYSYTYPEPPGFRERDLGVPGAAFDVELGEFVLPYRTVRESRDPDVLLLAFLRATFPDYLVPVSLVTVDRMPLAADGSVDLAALPPPPSGRRSDRPFVAPRTPLEGRLAQVWKRVLWLDADVGVPLQAGEARRAVRQQDGLPVHPPRRRRAQGERAVQLEGVLEQHRVVRVCLRAAVHAHHGQRGGEA